MAVQPWEFAAFPVGVSHATFDIGKSLFGKRRGGPPSFPDISSELARIDAIINQAREQAKISLNREAAVARGRLTSQLASRGILDSPVSGLNFQELEESRLAALANTDVGLLSRGAELRAGLMSQRAGQEYSAQLAQYQQRAQRQAALISGIAGLGASFFLPGGRAAPLFFSPNFKAGALEAAPEGQNWGWNVTNQSSPLSQNMSIYDPQLPYRQRQLAFF